MNNLRLQFTPAQSAAEKDLVVTVDAKSKMRQRCVPLQIGQASYREALGGVKSVDE